MSSTGYLYLSRNPDGTADIVACIDGAAHTAAQDIASEDAEAFMERAAVSPEPSLEGPAIGERVIIEDEDGRCHVIQIERVIVDGVSKERAREIVNEVNPTLSKEENRNVYH